MKKIRLSIIDNFLEEETFGYLEQLIQSDFPWYFQPSMVTKEEVSPGGFDHTVYHASVPISRFYSDFIPILEKLKVAILIRIRVNLNPRLPEPHVFEFHTDTEDLPKGVTNLGTTSILYINTNNGYTELEDGTKIESVANRLATFPTNTKHRIVTQTDEQRRILINFNYIKSDTSFSFRPTH